MLISETNQSQTYLYIYDESGSPIGFKHRKASYAENVWDLYLYEKNLLGDIVALYTSSGTKVADYYYNAWGNWGINCYDTGKQELAYKNPFRYRGYYFFYDLGLYYLQSRFYDCVTGRFINADEIAYLGTGTLISYNLFSYCGNNPINYYDPTGKYCVSHIDERNYLNDWILEGAGAGGSGASGNYFGYGTAYYNYSVYSVTSSYNSYLGGYYSRTLSTGIYNPGYYYVPGAVSTIDDTSTGSEKIASSTKAIVSQANIKDNKFSADQNALLQLAKEYKKTGLSLEEANLMWEWAKKYGLTGSRYHGPQYDSYLGGSQLHLKINGKHINIYD